MSFMERIDFLQRWILVNSYIYYEVGDSVVTDKQYDRTAYGLVDMQKAYEGDIKTDTQYGYAFYDFDGTTGFDLYYRLNESDKEKIIRIAHNVLHEYKKERRELNAKK